MDNFFVQSLNKIRNSKYITDAVAIIFLILIILIYHYCYMYKYLPIQEGWHQIIGNNILQGKLPYRDFHIILPPIFPYLCAFVDKFFGDTPSVFRIWGMLERIIIFPIIYIILRKLFSVQNVFWAVIVGFIFYANSFADYINTFYQTTLFFGIISLFFLLTYNEALKSNVNTSKRLLIIFLSSIFATLSLLTKHSPGLFTLFVITVSFIMIQIINKRKIWKDYIFFAMGFFIPICILLYYLYSNNISNNFFQMIFVDSLNCKGSNITNMLFSFILKYIKTPLFYINIIVLFILYYIFKKFQINIIEKANNNIVKNVIIISAIVIVTILYFSKTVIMPTWWATLFTNFKQNLLCWFLFITNILLFLGYSYKIFRKKEYIQNEVISLYILLFSLGILYSHGLSAQLEAHGCVLIMPFLISYLYNIDVKNNKAKNTIISILTYLLVVVCIMIRYNIPLCWWGAVEGPIGLSNYKINNSL